MMQMTVLKHITRYKINNNTKHLNQNYKYKKIKKIKKKIRQQVLIIIKFLPLKKIKKNCMIVAIIQKKKRNQKNKLT